MEGNIVEPLKDIKKINNLQIRSPKMDIYESREAYYIRISIPGVRKEDIKLAFTDNNSLEIKGNVKPIINKDFEKIISKEIYQGPFMRTLTLPKDSDRSKVTFSYQGGILEITMSKTIPLGDDSNAIW